MLITDLANALLDLDHCDRANMSYENQAKWILTHMMRDTPAAPAAVAPTPAPVKARPPLDMNNLLPTYANANRVAESIPAGRYAIEEAEGDDVVIKFYKIDKPTEGRWAGKTFLKIMASDNEYPIKAAARQIAVYTRIIEAGVNESSRRYGIELGHCGVCGRALTDPESITKGIGPVCEHKMGWS